MRPFGPDEISLRWDEYQNELVKIYYGGEAKAKKELVVFKTNPGSIIVPGLSGRTSLSDKWLKYATNNIQMRMLT